MKISIFLFWCLSGLLSFGDVVRAEEEAAADEDISADMDDLDNEDAPPAAVEEEASDVLVGTDGNLADLIKKHDYALVEFYAPWCGHCKALEPEYKKAAGMLTEQSAKTKLIKVDATAETALAQKYEVKGYPTMKHFIKGKMSEYDGPRTASGIVDWVTDKEKPPLEDWTEFAALDDEGIRAKLTELKIDFLILGDVTKNSVRYKSLFGAAQLFKQKKLGVTVASRYLPKGTDPKGPLTKVKLYRRYVLGQPEVAPVELKVWKDEVIVQKVQKMMYAGVNFLFSDSQKLFFPDGGRREGMEWVFVFQGPEGAEKNPFDPVTEAIMTSGEKKVEALPDVKLVKDLLKVGPSDKIAVAVVADTSLELSKVGAKTNFGRADPKKATLLMMGQSKNYAKQVEMTSMEEGYDFKAFVDEVIAGKVKPDYKTKEGSPEKEGNVVVLTGANFAEKALDAKSDVFVKFYAPWCGHCKQLAPVWTDIADKLKDYKGVTIAKFDATENECDEEVTGYPKLVFYPGKKNSWKKKMEYGGARDMENIVDFLFENAENLQGKSPPHLDLGGKKGSYNQVQRELEKKRKAKKTEL